MSSNGSVSVSGCGCRRYPKEFKDDAVRVVVELDKSIAAVARDLGVHKGTLGRWVALWRQDNPQVDRPLDASERRAWEADRRVLAELRMGNEFVKKSRLSSPGISSSHV